MKVVILAGGYGTRLSEYTDSIPKPMVPIGGIPILVHIMKNYANYGFNDFQIALGYKSEIIKQYFLNFKMLNSNFKIDLNNNEISFFNDNNLDWQVSLIDTGLNSMTGGRVKKMQPYIGENTFLMTYGDGLSDININELIKFHKSHGKMITVSAVRPIARFGEINIINNLVTSFKEKPQMNNGWINGGFFVIEPEFFKFINDDQTILEKEPLEKAVQMGELMAYYHHGFWRCMDTKRDKDDLEKLWKSNNAPWNMKI